MKSKSYMKERAQFILKLIELTIDEADKQGIDRDELIKHVAYMFEALSVSTTFKKYKN